MEFSKEYKVSVFNNGEGKELADYNVRFKAEGKKTIRVNVKELLLMVPGRVKFKMLDMRSVKIDEEEDSGFHEMREKIRAYIKKRGLMRQLEEINRIIAIDEFKAYLGMKEGEYIGFSKYFRERFR